MNPNRCTPKSKLKELMECQENYDIIVNRISNINTIIREIEDSISLKNSKRSSDKIKVKIDADGTRSDFQHNKTDIEQIEKQIAELDATLRMKKAEYEIKKCEREISILLNSSSELTLTSGVCPINVEDDTIKFLDSTHISSPPRHDQRYHECDVQTFTSSQVSPPSQFKLSDSKPSRVRRDDPVSRNVSVDPKASSLRFDAPDFVPRRDSDSQAYVQTDHFSHDINYDMQNQFSQFLLKKDMLLPRLGQYDDNPMHFMSWKISFRGIMHELGATPLEELDLLIAHLGPYI